MAQTITPPDDAHDRIINPRLHNVQRLAPARSGLARGGLAQLNSTTSSRAPSDAGDIMAERMGELQVSPARSKKKNKNKKKGDHLTTSGLEKPDFLLPQALKHASQASLQERLGKVANGNDDWNFVKRPIASTNSSTTSSPPRSGLSSLLNQAHPGDIATVHSSPCTPPTSDDGEHLNIVSYEVALDDDYVARDLESRPVSRAGRPIGTQRKKMTAEDFEVLKVLGKGAYGTVMLVRHKGNGRLFAQKQLKKASLVIHKKVIEQTKTERAILESVSHPNVVKLFYAFQDHEKLYLILE